MYLILTHMIDGYTSSIDNIIVEYINTFQRKKLDSECRVQLQWDKLIINNEVFVFCEDTGQVLPEIADIPVNIFLL